MQSVVRKFGNSAGIIIPKPVLAQLGAQAGDNMDLRIEGGRIVIEPIRTNPREGWAEAAKLIAEADDRLAPPK